MTTTIDRRKFLTYTGAAGAATGAAWVAPTVLGASTAFAAGSCEKGDEIRWTDYLDGAYEVGTVGQTFPLTPTRYMGPGEPDYKVNMSVTPVGSVSSRHASVRIANFSNVTAVYLLEMTGVADSEAESGLADWGWDITFSWPPGRHAYRLSLSIGDIDENNPDDPGYESQSPEFKDYVFVNNAPDSVGRDPDRVSGNGTGTPWTGIAGPQNDQGSTGQVTVNYNVGHELSSLTISYRGDPKLAGATQNIGITNLTWCL